VDAARNLAGARGEDVMNKLSTTLVALLLVLSASSSWSQSSEESAAKAAEQAGKLREALNYYVTALQKVSESSADDQRLREAIIKLVQRLSPPPTIPEEARRFSVRGHVWVKEAKNPSDFDEAAKEFGRALRVAPWWADGYINQGVSLEKAGKYNEAIRSLKLYLLAAPTAPDADKVKDQIYTLELRQEKAQRDAVAAREEQERKRREEEAKASDPARIAGEWCGLVDGDLRCMGTQITVKGTNVEIVTSGSYERFSGTIQGDELTGSFYSYLFGVSYCPAQPFPFRGRITSGGNRIELSYTQPRALNQCTVTSTWPNPGRTVLVRKPG